MVAGRSLWCRGLQDLLHRERQRRRPESRDRRPDLVPVAASVFSLELTQRLFGTTGRAFPPSSTNRAGSPGGRLQTVKYFEKLVSPFSGAMTASPTVQPKSPEGEAPAATGCQRQLAGPATPPAIASGPRRSGPDPVGMIASGEAQVRNATAAPLSPARRANARSAATKCAAGPLAGAGGLVVGTPGGTLATTGVTLMKSRADILHRPPSRRQAAV